MSLKLTTDRELDEFEEKRYLKASEDFILLNLFFRDDMEHKSYFPFAYNDKTVNERFVGYAGALFNQGTDDTSFDEPFPIDVDIYICANSMKIFLCKNSIKTKIMVFRMETISLFTIITEFNVTVLKRELRKFVVI